MLRIIALLCIARGSLGLSLDSTNRFNEREIHGTVNTSKLNERIVGGSVTSIRLYPYMVSVELLDKYLCGGSIISPEFVISAAHCFKLPYDFYNVRVGSSFASTGGILHSISEIIKHPNFEKKKLFIPDYDIILLRILVPITFSKTVQPVALQPAGKEVAAGTKAVFTGWGRTDEHAVSTESALRKVELPIISNDDCKKSHFQVTEKMICAFYRGGGRDLCFGDSGGPLVANGKQVGIAAWTVGCGLPGYPGGYTKIAVVRNWIKQNTGI